MKHVIVMGGERAKSGEFSPYIVYSAERVQNGCESTTTVDNFSRFGNTPNNRDDARQLARKLAVQQNARLVDKSH